jgi:hypothetical protein
VTLLPGTTATKFRCCRAPSTGWPTDQGMRVYLIHPFGMIAVCSPQYPPATRWPVPAFD